MDSSLPDKGGAGVIAADACLQSGLYLADLGHHTLQKMVEKAPSWTTVGNPVDVEPLAETVGSVEACKIAFKAALSDKSVDLCLSIMGTLRIPEITTDFLEDIKNASFQKPIALCIIGRQEIYEQFFRIAEEVGTPVFNSVRRAVNGLVALYRHSRLRV